MSIKPLRRVLLVCLLLPFLYFGTASATYFYHVHSDVAAFGGVAMRVLPEPSAQQRIVIFSPHPDDETLGCAGLIRQAVRAGARVWVVFLTNGDAFTMAVERQYREVRPQAEDYVRFASLRQQESRAALSRLGLPASQVRFLGFPDRGLMRLWDANWSPDAPYTSPYTRRSRVRDARSMAEGAPYCGNALLAALLEVLRDTAPTDVYVTHPSDDHPDHAAASAFVTRALDHLRAEGGPVGTLRYYLVHRGDWPLPQGLRPDLLLEPPAGMRGLNTHWQARPLSRDDVRAKRRALRAYASQTAMMGRFLTSFVRRSELFGEMREPTAPRIPDGRIRLDGDRREWGAVVPAVLDPVSDSLLRSLQQGGDVAAIYACRDTRNLYLGIAMYQSVARGLRVRMRLRYFGDPAAGEAGGRYNVSVAAPVLPLREGRGPHRDRDWVEVAVPLREIGYARRVAVSVDTRVAGLTVDRTGYRFLHVQ